MKGWRTLFFQLLTVIFVALEAFDWTSVLSDKNHAASIVVFIALINTVLRFITTSSVGGKVETPSSEVK